MAASDDLKGFTFKTHEVEKLERVESYDSVERNVDVQDFADRFDFDFGSDDLGF